ncbi:MAG: hypothetical protein WDN49_17625 [Acetobacteraceae bacterium]
MGGLVLSGSGANTANFVFGSSTPGATVRNRAELDRYFDYNMIYGNQDAAIGEDGLDGLYKNFRSRMRHYPAGDPDDVHVIGPHALSLRAHCDGAAHADCSDGHIFGGMIRPYNQYLPGSFIEVCYRMPTANWGWSVPWLAGGSQTRHAPGTSVYAHGVNGPESTLHYQKFYAEIDMNDGFSRAASGVPVGHAVTPVTPHYNPDDAYVKQPRTTYLADSNGYTAHASAQPPFVETSADLSTSVHCNALNWRGDGSNLIDILLDGRVIFTQYIEYHPDIYTGTDGAKHPVAMHLMVSNQVGPKFARDIGRITDQGAGWDMAVTSLRSWWPTLPSPAATASATRPNNNAPGARNAACRSTCRHGIAKRLLLAVLLRRETQKRVHSDRIGNTDSNKRCRLHRVDLRRIRLHVVLIFVH